MPSIGALEKLLAAEPRDTFVLYALAQEHARAGRHAQAIGFYDRCLEADRGYCYAYYHKAKSQLAQGDEQAAMQTLRTGVAVAKETQDIHALSELLALLADLGVS